MRVCEAEGNGTEAERILREEVCNRTDDDQPPPDLSERTTQIIRNHQWLRPDPGPDDRGSDHEDVTAAS